MTERCTEFLKQNHPFTVLTTEEMDLVCGSGDEERPPAGAIIIRQGAATSAYLYLVAEGQMRLERDGAEIQVLERGDCFGYPSIIAGSAPTASVVAPSGFSTDHFQPSAVFSTAASSGPKLRSITVSSYRCKAVSKSAMPVEFMIRMPSRGRLRR